MAITLISKSKTVINVGDAKKEPVNKEVFSKEIPDEPVYQVGHRVVITNDKYYWQKAFLPGDTGFVEKVSNILVSGKSHRLYTITLDSPRSLKQVFLRAWEFNLCSTSSNRC